MADNEIRITFAKRDRAKFISHLDLLRTMQRALKRAEIPLWYTQGFNPHAYISFPLALSVGTSSEVELMDIKLDKEMSFAEIKDRLNKQLPEGLEVLKVANAIKYLTEIYSSEYIIKLGGNALPSDIKNNFVKFMSNEKIEVEKRSKKKGINIVDIKPFINVISMDVNNDEFKLVLRLPSGTQFNINTGLVLDAFFSMIDKKIDILSIERTKILCESGEIFA